jgi:hypothetical protein
VVHHHGGRLRPLCGRVSVPRPAISCARPRMGRLARHRRQRGVLCDLPSGALLASGLPARSRQLHHLQEIWKARARSHPSYGLQRSCPHLRYSALRRRLCTARAAGIARLAGTPQVVKRKLTPVRRNLLKARGKNTRQVCRSFPSFGAYSSHECPPG